MNGAQRDVHPDTYGQQQLRVLFSFTRVIIGLVERQRRDGSDSTAEATTHAWVRHTVCARPATQYIKHIHHPETQLKGSVQNEWFLFCSPNPPMPMFETPCYELLLKERKKKKLGAAARQQVPTPNRDRAAGRADDFVVMLCAFAHVSLSSRLPPASAPMRLRAIEDGSGPGSRGGGRWRRCRQRDAQARSLGRCGFSASCRRSSSRDHNVLCDIVHVGSSRGHGTARLDDPPPLGCSNGCLRLCPSRQSVIRNEHVSRAHWNSCLGSSVVSRRYVGQRAGDVEPCFKSRMP